MGSDGRGDCHIGDAIVFQSTLPRGERLCRINPVAIPREISIHAPTWGATPGERRAVPAKLYFNPRSHVGSDENFLKLRRRFEISIHAPTWGATIAKKVGCCFIKFQSTLPRGERRHYRRAYVYHSHFNPRSHVGSDTPSRADAIPLTISIHAPTWGATSFVIRFVVGVIISIHAPTWGATPGVWGAHKYPENFNPRSHVGSDPGTLMPSWRILHFNPRSHVGSDPSSVRPKKTSVYFNPRSHVGSDFQV